MKIHDRDTMLELLSDSIDNIKKKIDHGKIRNPTNEKIKLDQYRALIYACSSYNAILKDKQIDELTNKLKTMDKLVINTQSNEIDLFINETINKLKE